MIDTIMLVLFGASLALLVAAAVVALIRMSIGPTNMDRIAASDVVTGILLAAIAAYVILTKDDTTLPVMLALGMVGFAGPIAMARFLQDDRAVEEQPEEPTRPQTEVEDTVAGGAITQDTTEHPEHEVIDPTHPTDEGGPR